MHSGTGSPRLTLLLTVLVALCAVIAFLPAIEGAWVYDDTILIRDNRLVHALDHVQKWFSGTLFDAPLAVVKLHSIRPFYRPLVVTSYGWDYFWGDGSPVAFHLSNLALHVGVSVLGFRALYRWLHSLYPAFWAVLLFSIHPSKAESVAWISGRPDPMFALFLLLALEFYQWTHSTSWRRLLGWFGFGLSAVAALLAKETAVLLPAFVVVDSYLRLGCPPLDSSVVRRLGRSLLAPCLFVTTYLALRFYLLPLAPGDQSSWALGTRAGFALETWGRLTELAVFPSDLSMMKSRIQTVHGKPVISLGYAAVGATVGLGCVLLLGILGKRHASLDARRALALLSLSIVALFPVLQIVPIGINMLTQPRFLYLPLLPLCALVGLFLGAWPRVLHALSVVLTLSCLLTSFHRSGHFENERQFWGYELAKNPSVPEVVRTQLGYDLVLGGRPLALRRAICGFEASQLNYGSSGAASFLADGLDLAFASTLDGAPSLAQAVQFLSDLRQARSAQFSGTFELRVEPSSVVAQEVRRALPPWLVREAGFRARLGQTESAKQLLSQALAQCPKCDDISYLAAKIAVLAGETELALQFARPLGEEALHRFRSVAQLIEMAREGSGPKAAFELSGVGRLLADPALSYRAVLPFADMIQQSRHEDTIMTLALISLQGGDLERALSIYDGLPEQAQRRLDELGFPQPIEDRERPFVSGTCALPSELN